MKKSVIIISVLIIALIVLPLLIELSVINQWFINFCIIGLVIAEVLIIYHTYVKPLKELDASIEDIKNGESRISKVKSSDKTISKIENSVSMMTHSISNALNFISHLEKGQYDKEYVNLDEKFDDQLADSLVRLRDNLKDIAEQDKIRNWVAEGLGKFVDILRAIGEEDLNSLADRILSNLVRYLNANQGQMFILNDDDEYNKHLELIAYYAYERKKYERIDLDADSGLIGQAYKEKETIYLTDVPQDFVRVTSGLGESTPTSLLIVPLKVNDEVYGILEIASFENFEKHEIEFIERLGESIASTISTAKLNERTRKLLEDSQQQSEELRAQEEEMRQNMEELQATQEEVQRQMKENEKIQSDLILEKALLDSLMQYLPEYVYFKDLDSRFIRISDSMLKIFPVGNIKEMVGKSDFDFVDKSLAQGYYDEEQEIIRAKKGFVDKIKKEKFDNGVVQWSSITKMPIVDSEGSCIGTFGITKDITEIKELEITANIKNEELMAQEEELKSNINSMEEAQKELAKEKSLLDALMNNLPDYIYFKDIDSKFIRASRSMTKLFPIKDISELEGKSDFDFHKKEAAEKYFKDEQNIIKNKKGIVDQVQHEVMDNGFEQWVSTTKLPLLDQEGKPMGTFGITKDITQFKKLELEAKEQNEELLAQEEELRQNMEEMKAIQDDMEKTHNELAKEKSLLDAIMDNLPDYVYFKDLKSKFIRASRSMTKLFPIKKIEELIGKSDFDFHRKEAAEKYYQDEQKIIQTKKGVIDQIQHEIMDNGFEQWVSTTKLPLLDQEGKPMGTFGITKDITQFKKLELDAKEQNEELLAQEEELRQNMEELQAIQEDMTKKEQEYKKEIEKLRKNQK